MKKTLLIAAAALVAGIVSSEAQVYSVNVVGYVNVPCPAGVNVFVATPLDSGNNTLTNVLQGVPANTGIQLWDPVNGVFTALSYTGPANNRHWKDSGNNVLDNTLIPTGTGYFLKSGGSGFTNTFVGSVVALSGANVTNNLTAGITVAIGSLIPYAGAVTNTSALNLVPPANTSLQLWDPVAQSFSGYNFTGPANNRTWKDGGNNVVVPQLAAGQAFFLKPGGATTYSWIQHLQ